MFHKMFPSFISERMWAIVFTVFSFIVSNFGLNAIITYAIPFLMFIYPLAISLIILALFGKFFNYDKRVFASTTIFTFLVALLDFIVSFPKDSFMPLNFIEAIGGLRGKLPLADIGLAWVVPAIVGLIIGIIVTKVKPQSSK